MFYLLALFFLSYINAETQMHTNELFAEDARNAWCKFLVGFESSFFHLNHLIQHLTITLITMLASHLI